MKEIILFFLITIPFLFSCTSKDMNDCTIKGEIIGCKYKTLLLFKSNQDIRYLSEKIFVDKNNTFKHTIVNPTGERYSLTSEEEFDKNIGTAYRVNFFTDSKSIELKIHSIDRLNENEIYGSELSSKLLQFEKEEKKWIDSIQHKNHSNVDSINNVFFSNKLRYIKENQNIIGYSILIDLIQLVDYIKCLDKNELKQVAFSLQKKYPNHPYSEIIEFIKALHVGGHYSNFEAFDKEGKLIEIGDIIKANKVTLIDLWSPWCGPCINNGREMIPLYKKYKSAGFEIIGVVGGIKNIESYKNAIAKENSPWQNLSEINNQNKIWQKYNIMGAGGGMFLIDNKGSFLAINPSIDEIGKILKEKL